MKNKVLYSKKMSNSGTKGSKMVFVRISKRSELWENNNKHLYEYSVGSDKVTLSLYGGRRGVFYECKGVSRIGVEEEEGFGISLGEDEAAFLEEFRCSGLRRNIKENLYAGRKIHRPIDPAINLDFSSDGGEETLFLGKRR
ncbi:uncharacterized protein Eint_040440 [Encephalitozoon intestinalis ATCC 50506]|uniref:Uncharacterized protein n=1 Tax=Encephalitozoon intestinalis (strain ATCC 50506) TaxID=876142 RepID=E0S6J9_ENCIT|nr:uncharacterized protein Eint_040440 [Encephalitozoon intestinalis ATCC 50506]ADM11334.1 hypothetical protein Eint_040440 [Encephalitozoon intestinalis ATCC 50506]UTX45022.1 hypothetical protein GPK93_04g05580 [Encephalitozoon intestinalis]